MNKFLYNDKLILRAPEPEDLELLYEWENDTDVWKYSSAISPYSKFLLRQYIEESTTDIFQSKQLRFMIELRSTKEAIGSIDLYDFDAINSRCGVGIYIESSFRSKGYARQALKLLEDYAFHFLNMNQLYAVIPVSNDASMKLFLNTGYNERSILKEWIFTNGTYEDAIFAQKIKR